MAGKKIHLLIGVVMAGLMGAALFYVQTFTSAQTNDNEMGNTNVNVLNTAPVVGNPSLTYETTPIANGGTVVPIPGATTTFTATGSITDINGDTTTMTSAFIVRGTGGCNLASLACYNLSCTVTATGDPAIRNYSCTVEIPYNADNTTGVTAPGVDYSAESWGVVLWASDGVATGGNTYGNFELMQMAALGVPGSLNLGEATIGGGPTAEVSHTVTNYGNTQIDIHVKSDNDFICQESKIIPRGDLRWHAIASQAYANMFIVKGAWSVEYASFDLAKKAYGATSDATKPTYWKFQTTTGVPRGECRLNNLVISATAG